MFSLTWAHAKGTIFGITFGPRPPFTYSISFIIYYLEVGTAEKTEGTAIKKLSGLWLSSKMTINVAWWLSSF